MLVQLIWSSGKRRKCAEVNRQDRLGLNKLRSECGFPGSHGVETANRKHRQIRMIELFDELHIGEHGGVAGVIEHRAIGDREYETYGDSGILGSALPFY